MLWIYIDERGVVQKSQVQQSSGYNAMDMAAMSTADKMEFSPAKFQDEKTAVWFAQAITFKTQ